MSLLKHTNWPSTLGGSLLSDLFEDDRFFNSPWLAGRSMPAVNVKETEKNFEIEVAAPGYSKKDFTIAVENGLLTVSAEKQEEKEKKEDNYTRREFGYASFSRSFNLPQNTNEDDINARYEDGILKLSISKKNQDNGKNRKSITVG